MLNIVNHFCHVANFINVPIIDIISLVDYLRTFTSSWAKISNLKHFFIHINGKTTRRVRTWTCISILEKRKKLALTLPNLSHKITTSVQEIATTRYFCKDLISTFLYYPLWCMTMQHIGPRCEPNSWRWVHIVEKFSHDYLKFTASTCSIILFRNSLIPSYPWSFRSISSIANLHY